MIFLAKLESDAVNKLLAMIAVVLRNDVIYSVLPGLFCQQISIGAAKA